jgi:4-amino-4-deoxy-L-arabinose transferase-like glycosyltransferase
LLFLIILALLLYVAFMSCSFDEWDSYNFALALRHYDVVRHQPHPPGFPLYVFAGYIALYLVRNPLTALTIISAISGALTVAPAFVLSRRMYDRRTAVLTSLALIFTPALWIASESALSDAFFTFLLLLAICLLYLGIKGSTKTLQTSWFVYGLAIGARPTPAALTLLALWVPWTIFVARRIRCRMLAIKGALLFAASCLAWFIPMICVVGWANYWLAMQRDLIWASNMDFFWARTLGLDPIQRLIYVIMQFAVFSLGGAFVGVNSTFSSTNPFLYFHGMLLLVALTTCMINFKNIPGKLFLFLWIVPYFAFVYLFGSPNYPRYYLPLVPAIMIPVVASAVAVGKAIRRQPLIALRRSWIKSWTGFFFAAILITSFFVGTLPLAVIIHTQQAPTKQLFDYVTANYLPGTVIIECSEHRVFQFYPNEITYLNCRVDEKKVIAELSRFFSEPTHTTLLMTSSAYRYFAQIPAVAELRVTAIVEFFRDPHVVMEENKVVLYQVVSAKIR